MKIHLLSGFLGSGKTTAIRQASLALLQQGVKTGVITNDQGSQLVDGGLFQYLNIPNRQVINGCFCCNYQQLDNAIASLAATAATEVVFAESVGSCTDIVATVLKPLLQFRKEAQVTVSTFADTRLLQMILVDAKSPFDEEVRYIYLKQLEEAGIIVLNKIDLINEQALQQVKTTMQEKYGDKILLYQNSLDKDCIQQWLNTLNEYKAGALLSSLDIDYDIYAAGEAKMGWVDQSLEIAGTGNNAMQLAEDLINKIFQTVKTLQYPIGHIKYLVNDAIKISFTSFSDPFIHLPQLAAASVSLLINMRVQAAPGALAAIIENAVKEMEMQSGCSVIQHSLAAFKPGYPAPAYRL